MSSDPITKQAPPSIEVIIVSDFVCPWCWLGKTYFDAAVQVIEGATHRRGMPPAVVEMNTKTWLALALGRLTWAEATRDGRVHASGARSDLSGLLPLETSGEI